MKYKKYICILAAVCLLGTAAFCGYQVYNHYSNEAKQTEVFQELVQTVQKPDEDAPEIPYSEEENVLAEYGELFLQNSDMVGWISIAGTTINYPVMQTPDNPNYYLKQTILKKSTAIWACRICRRIAAFRQRQFHYLRSSHQRAKDVRLWRITKVRAFMKNT
jgi:hypothetical protein